MRAEESLSRAPTVATKSILFRKGKAPEQPSGPRQGIQLRSEAFGGPAIGGRLEIADIAWLQVLRMTAASHRLVHSPSPDVDPVVTMWLQIRGTSVIEQQGRSVRLVPGRWSLANSLYPYTLVSLGHTQRLVLLVPAERIHPLTDFDELTTRSFSGTAGIARLAFDAARSAVEQVLGSTPAVDLAESVCNLVGLALQEGKAGAHPDADRSTLMDRVHSYVADHLSDPDLSMESIASSLRVSKRSLHRAAREAGCSIHELIWRRRLESCLNDLLEPVKAHLGIGDIAHSWGFKNLTHFSRAFREHFGISARDARRLARESTRP